MSSILDEIVETKRERLDEERRVQPLSEVKRHIPERKTPRFRAALTEEGIQLISEIKPESPSQGRITELRPREIARIYEQECSAAVSVLTDEPYFGQGLEALVNVRDILGKPILRKDFTIDAYQIYQAAAAGADAILLIAAILSPHQLHEYHEMAGELGLDSLVEIHTLEELERLPFTPPLLGVNNRTLEGDFSTDLAVTETIAPDLPEDTVLISESGIHERADVERLERVPQVDAILVGTSLLRDTESAETVRERLRALMGVDDASDR